MVREEREETPGPGEVLVKVAGCGVCHTDLGFYYDGIPTRKGFPLILGHEVSGTVVEAGEGAGEWKGRQVIVPAVIPCGSCRACSAGRGSICPRGLCWLPDLSDARINPGRLDLASLSVVADAVSTPYQAILRSSLEKGDLAVFVGVGGVGGFGVQIAAALGAAVIAVDVSEERLAAMEKHGAALTLRPDQKDFKELKSAVKAFADSREIPSWRQKIFETSGTPQGQATAFGLLGRGGYLSVVGFTAHKVELRLSNLMAMDATAQGNWGCLPEHYSALVDLILSEKVALEPFLEHHPLDTINEIFARVHQRKISRRVVLVPEE